jgi:hypothetical protein
MDNGNQHHTSVTERASSFFGVLGLSFVLNIALIAWSVYKEYWWIAAIALVIGIVMIWQALTLYRNKNR